MTTLSFMNTIYATGSLFSNGPPLLPLHRPASSPHSRGPSLLSVSCLILFSDALFFYSPNQGRCSPSIANWLGLWTFITRQQEVCTVEMWESGSVLSGGMWAHPRDRRYHHARHQRHVVSARFIVELIETFDDNWLVSLWVCGKSIKLKNVEELKGDRSGFSQSHNIR